MKNIIISIFLVLASFIFQNTICQFIAFGNIVPNLLIITVSSFGFIKGKKSGVLAGFFSGLLVDIFFSNILGFHALLYMYVGYFNGFFKRMFYKDELKLQILLIGCSDFIFNIIYYLLMFLLRRRFHFSFYLINIILPEVVYTILLTIVIYVVMIVFQKIFMKNHIERSNEFV